MYSASTKRKSGKRMLITARDTFIAILLAGERKFHGKGNTLSLDGQYTFRWPFKTIIF